MVDEGHNTLAHHVAHLLRHIWDPIGLGAQGPVDEYDRYVPEVAMLVQGRTVFETVIAAHLMGIESGEMGMSPAPARAKRAARALLGLQEAFTRAPDVLVTQAVSPDGLRCIWVFRRPDGLHSYEHAAFWRETDENGEYCWWAVAGGGRSGLFPTAELAKAEARATINWLRGATEPSPVFVFRDGRFARSETVVSAAPLDLVVSVYGGGGLKGEAGLEEIFGGSAYFCDEETGSAYLAVWGARNASRFRSRLRRSGAVLEIIRQPPPARLMWFNTGLSGQRPDHRWHLGPLGGA